MTLTMLPTPPSTDVSGSRLLPALRLYFSRLTSGSPERWNLTTAGGLLTLVLIWAGLLHTTWATWGSLTIDSGHEMYVPAVLSEGKMLYRDVWFMYGPLAAYFNSYLFRVFGVHLSVLYWAGSLSALASAVFLYLTGMRLSSWLAGWAAGAVLLLEAFHPTFFCFPLPYSYNTVYACMIACLFLWLVVSASATEAWGWIFVAGLATAALLLLKLEFGVASYITLGILVLVRGQRWRSWRSIGMDFAAILPGLLICGLVIRWMVSIAGLDFILHENFMSWPTSYFMKVYGKFWLAQTGFSLSLLAFAEAAKQTLVLFGFWQGVHLFLVWRRTQKRAILFRAGLFIATLAYLAIYVPGADVLRVLFFSQNMVLYVLVAAVAAFFLLWRQPELQRAPGVILLAIFASLVSFRILLRMTPWDYAIYYNGPVVLGFLLLLRPLIPQIGDTRRAALVTELLICLGCVAVPALYTRKVLSETAGWVALTTERGTINVKPNLAEQYRAAIRFMKVKNARGEAVLSVPEDTSLYFLSGTHCPTRIYSFNPGVIVPGKMTGEIIRDLEKNNVKYLIWSNRLYPEYGVLRFGVDFDREMGEYFTSHYRRKEALAPNFVRMGEWNAYVWERTEEVQP